MSSYYGECQSIVDDVHGAGLLVRVERLIDRASKNPPMLDHEIGNCIGNERRSPGLPVVAPMHMCVLPPPRIIAAAQVADLLPVRRRGLGRATQDVVRARLSTAPSDTTRLPV